MVVVCIAVYIGVRTERRKRGTRHMRGNIAKGEVDCQGSERDRIFVYEGSIEAEDYIHSCYCQL